MDGDLFDARPKQRLNVLPPHNDEGRGRFPSWLRVPFPKGKVLFETGAILEKHQMHTVCEEAKCPNRFECYSKKTATFLVLGHECTRKCGFCDIDFSKTPKAPDPKEPERLALCARDLGLKHVVITMVARDDLIDGGAFHLVQIVRELKDKNPHMTVELLTSDFEGKKASLDRLREASFEVFNHNIETVRRLSPRIRNKADYDRTLGVLHDMKTNSDCLIKSGLMVGHGETKEEVFQTISDLKDAGCDIVTIGQYLQASSSRVRLKEFIHPTQFEEYRQYGLNLGIKEVYSAPFVRSSYHAQEHYEQRA